MPLSEVRQGMKCTGYSVFKGIEVDKFDVEILDIFGGAGEGSRILVKVSGPAVDPTGIGAGFSGSPVYCPDPNTNQLKNAGAISETIGEYGGKTVLATPIEQIIGTSPDQAPPAMARTLAAPLTIRGLSAPVYRSLASAAARKGRLILQAPQTPLNAPAQQSFRPGSAVSVGLSSGDVALGAVGTVAYTDQDKVWVFGHQFDGVGQRSLLLQDAYVAAIVNNPVQLPESGGTYKLAGALNNVGTVTNDGVNAVSGKVGPLPTLIPVRVFAHDEDRKIDTTTEVMVVDETDIGSPTGASALSYVAPITVSQAAAGIAGSAPSRLSGEMCMRLTLRERPKPVRVCNRYVSDGTGTSAPTALGNIVALRAGSDIAELLALVDSYKPAGLHVTEIAARINVRRGQRQAFMRKLTVPRRVRPGQRIPVSLSIQRVRGQKETLKFKVKLPASLRSGPTRIVLKGSDADTGDEDLFGALTITLGEPDVEEDTVGPRTVTALVKEMRKLERYDGLRLSGKHAYKDPNLRIGGSVSAFTNVARR